MPPIPQPMSTNTPTPPAKSPATGLMIALFAVVILGLIAQYAMFTMSDASRSKESALLSARMMSLEKTVGDLAQKSVVVPSPAATQPTATVSTGAQGVWTSLDVSGVASLSAFEARFSGLRIINDIVQPFTVKPGEIVRLNYVIGGGTEYLYVSLKAPTQQYSAPLDVVTVEVMNDGKLANARSASVTLNETQGQMSVSGFQLKVTEFTPSGVTTFKGLTEMY